MYGGGGSVHVVSAPLVYLFFQSAHCVRAFSLVLHASEYIASCSREQIYIKQRLYFGAQRQVLFLRSLRCIQIFDKRTAPKHIIQTRLCVLYWRAYRLS